MTSQLCHFLLSTNTHKLTSGENEEAENDKFQEES